ncbi:MAG: hypothetical protein CMO80_13775 [Verrucomicrobiales bacterium]|nr:hypothetical protein [Verrucomicrobiales bacterium]|tara:strand:+ start:2065 stop:2451 length:387 start_codon:yes stop_codon:yes gene_type:complete
MATPLPKKLLLKPGTQARFINTPAGFWETFGTLPGKVALQSGGKETCDWTLLFAKSEHELKKFAENAIESLKLGSIFWVAFPKKTSGEQTTLSMREGWTILEEAGYEPVASASIDATWSAQRFRPTVQ